MGGAGSRYGVAVTDGPGTQPAATQDACPGCGIVLPQPAGVASPHIGTSPGCWAAYGDVVGREYGEWGFPPVHRLTSDTYMVQHPGEPTPAAIQSMAAHLISLHLSLDRGIEAGRLNREIGRIVADPSVFRWLDPPRPVSWLTVMDVKGAGSLREHSGRVQRWARSVWEAWSDHHETIRRWTGH